jgi:Tfp pilus assembly protein PilX
MTPQPPAAPQRGAITLLVAIGLVLLASLVGFYSARSVLLDQLTSHNHARASQARLAAEAALASAQAMVQSAAANSTAQPNALFSTSARCPAGLSGAAWQCAALSIPPHPAMPQVQLSAVAVRDLVASPHVVMLQASASHTGQNSQATVRESVFMPVLAPAPTLAAPAALVLNGCVSEAAGASLRVCPISSNATGTHQACSGTPQAPAVLSHFVEDTQRDGLIALAEKNACLALNPASLPGGGNQTGPGTAVPRSPCNRAAWRSVLGDTTDAQLQAWSTAQERQGLNAQSTPPRSVYWIDSPVDWLHSVGTADHPALLVFSAQACALRCPRIGAQVRIVGSVVFDSGCNDDKMRGWQGGTIEGQLVVESGLPEWRSGQVLAHPNARKAYTLHWPEGIDATQIQRVNGSWSEGAP